LSTFIKFLLRLCRGPISNDISFDDMSRFLKSIGCSMRKKSGGSHRHFKHPDYEKTITLMENTAIRRYQINDVRELLEHLDMCPEEEE